MLYMAALNDPLLLSLIGITKPVKLNYEKIKKTFGNETADQLKNEIAAVTGR